MEGRFIPHELAEVIRNIFLSELTGLLEVSRPGEPALIFEFDRGMLGWAEGDPELTLARQLASEAKVSRGQLAELRGEGLPPREYGAELLRREWIEREALAGSCQEYLGAMLQAPLRWPAGEYRFREGEVPVPPVEANVLGTVEAFLQAIEGMLGFDAIVQALQSIDRPIVLRTGQGVPVESLRLSAGQGFLLSRMDGTLSIKEVLQTLGTQEEMSGGRFIYALLLLGAAGFEPPFAAGPLVTSSIMNEHVREHAREREETEFIRHRYESSVEGSPYALLGIAEGAPWEEIQEAYNARKAEIAPERFLEKVRNQMRSEIRILEGRLVEAYLALQSSSMQARQSREDGVTEQMLDMDILSMRREVMKTDVKLGQEEAEKQADGFYQKARKYFQQGDYHNCIQYCSLALKYSDGVARFHHLLGDAQVRNPDHRWQKMAEQSFLRAVELDPWNADYLVSLGQFYRRQGLAMRARRHFEKALEILPTHPVALEELAALTG